MSTPPAYGHDAMFKEEVEHEEDLKGLSTAVYVPNTAAEVALVRKIDLRMIPMLWFMYVWNYIDRSNIGNAKVGGMEVDLALSSSDYSLALSIFFVGYLLNEIPSNMLLVRSRPSLFLPGLMLVWGAISVGAKGINNLAGLVAFRFILGIVEAGFFPGVIYLLSCWYKPFELAKRVAWFYSASLISGAFGGLFAGVITEYMDGVGGTRGWKWLFVIEGICTCVVAVCAVFILPDYPSTTRWLSTEEQELAILRLSAVEEDNGAAPLSHLGAFKAAVKDPKTWIFTLAYVAIAGAGTISYFFPTLMTVLGYSGRNAQFMTCPIYVVALIIQQITAFSSDRFQEKPFHAMGCTALGGIMFLLCAVVSQPVARYVFICFGGAGLWSTFPIFLSYMMSNFEGKEKRAVVIAIVNGLGNLASVYGSYLWPSTAAPQYASGFGATCGLILLGGFVCVGYRLYYGDNTAYRLREKAAADAAAESAASRA